MFGIMDKDTSRNPEPNARLLRVKDVCQLTGLSRTGIHRLVKLGEFPQPVKLTERSVFWFDDEVAGWIARLRELRGQKRPPPIAAPIAPPPDAPPAKRPRGRPRMARPRTD
jgi:prophage regulatory protein